MQTLHFENIAAALNKLIRAAKKSIRITSGYYTSHELTNALCSAIENNNIDIQLIVDKDYKGEDELLSRLAEAGGLVYIYDEPHHKNLATMHNKFCVIDGETLVTGSFNWTNNAEKNNQENIIIVKSPKLAQQSLKEFKRLRDSKFTKGIPKNSKSKDTKYDLDGGLDFTRLSIDSFHISNSTPKIGDNVTISWTVKGASILKLYQDGKEKEVSQKTSITIQANKAESIILAAKNEYGDHIEKTLFIDVEQPLYPTISEFKTNKGSAPIGKGEEITVSWKVENAAEVWLENTNDFKENVGLLGSRKFKIEADSKFYLSAKKSDGTETVATLFANIYTPAPIIHYFKSNNEYSCFLPDEVIIISWKIENSTKVYLYEEGHEDDKIKVAAISSKTYLGIKKDTNFILKVFNSSGDSIENKLHINIMRLADIKVSAPNFVIPQPPVIDFPGLPIFPNLDTSNNSIIAQSVSNLKSSIDNIRSMTLNHLRLIYPMNDPNSAVIIKLEEQNRQLEQELVASKNQIVALKEQLKKMEYDLKLTKDQNQELKAQVQTEKQKLSENEAKNKGLQEQLKKLREEVKAEKQKLSDCEANHQGLQEQLNKRSKEVQAEKLSPIHSDAKSEELQNKIYKLNNEIERINKNLSSYEAKNKDLQEQISKLKEAYKKENIVRYNKILMFVCILFFAIIIALLLNKESYIR